MYIILRILDVTLNIFSFSFIKKIVHKKVEELARQLASVNSLILAPLLTSGFGVRIL